MIELVNIGKTYYGSAEPVVAIENINLTIEDGDIFGIIGLSGAGKSTLVRCINLLEKPTEGKVIFDGTDICSLNAKELRTVRRKISMIFQSFNLLEQRMVLGNICYPLEISGVSREKAKEKARALLGLVGLSDKEKAYPSQLSGGQKQRVAIAGVLAMMPDCIVFDEATAMLDPSGRKDIVATMKKLNTEKKMTVITITHHMNEAALADRIIVMNRGRVFAEGAPVEIFRNVEAMKSIGLSVPQVTELCWMLKKDGLSVDTDVLHAMDAADRIERLFRNE